MPDHSGYDLDYRPRSYWVFRDHLQKALATIKGTLRRESADRILKGEPTVSIDPYTFDESLAVGTIECSKEGVYMQKYVMFVVSFVLIFFNINDTAMSNDDILKCYGALNKAEIVVSKKYWLKTDYIKSCKGQLFLSTDVLNNKLIGNIEDLSLCKQFIDEKTIEILTMGIKHNELTNPKSTAIGCIEMFMYMFYKAEKNNENIDLFKFSFEFGKSWGESVVYLDYYYDEFSYNFEEDAQAAARKFSARSQLEPDEFSSFLLGADYACKLLSVDMEEIYNSSKIK